MGFSSTPVAKSPDNSTIETVVSSVSAHTMLDQTTIHSALNAAVNRLSRRMKDIPCCTVKVFLLLPPGRTIDISSRLVLLHDGLDTVALGCLASRAFTKNSAFARERVALLFAAAVVALSAVDATGGCDPS